MLGDSNMTVERSRVRVLTWKEAREDVLSMHPRLANIIDKINPPSDFHLIKANYSFGDTILNERGLHIHTEKGLLPITDTAVDHKLQIELVRKTAMPIGMVLNKSIELDLHVGARMLPFKLMRKGHLFGLWGLLPQESLISFSRHIWSITAGTRCLSLLPKIHDAAGFQKIKKKYPYLKFSGSKHFDNQWYLLVELARHAQEIPWSVDLLYFSTKWMDQLESEKNDDNPYWGMFKLYMYQTAWKDTGFLRDGLILNSDFAYALEEYNVKSTPYLSDMIKHLYAMIEGFFPGFVFAHDDSSAPISTLQKVFSEVYDLKYFPTFFQPGYLSYNHPLSGMYYSLQWPTSLECSPKYNRKSTKMADLRDIKYVVNTTLKGTKYKRRNSKYPISQIDHLVDFRYFHCDHDPLGEIEHTSALLGLEPVLQEEQQRYQKDFCETSPLIRGCIRLSLKSE